jgi:hypothetical protein
MFDDIVPPLIPKTVQILFLDGDRIRASGTAFFFCNYLITCHHVYWGPKNTGVVIRFSDANPDVSKLLNQQEQLQQICDEILRSSNTGMASAVTIQHLLREPVIREREHLWH